MTNVGSAFETMESAKKICDWISENNIQVDQQKVTDDNGTALFDVDTGVYVVEKVSEEGTMAPILFFLTEEMSGENVVLAPKFGQSVTPDNPDDPNNPDNPYNPEDSNEPDVSEELKQPVVERIVTLLKTGDNAKVVLWIGILIIALIGILLINKKRESR